LKSISPLTPPSSSYQRGDELPDELACGGSARQCIATGLAMGMTVPIPGFALLGGLSHGRESHFHAPMYISLVVLHTKQRGRYEIDFTAHG
jgi:hypothetical protein